MLAGNTIVPGFNGHSLFAPESESYQWFFNGRIIPGESGREIYPEKSGVYTVVTENDNGFVASASVTVQVTADAVRKIYVIGDSTASFYETSRYPRTGWGQVLQPFFLSDSIHIVNKAMSGRSSKSYYSDPAGWPAVLKVLEKGDFLFIQFGHNDAKIEDTTRYTEPYTTYKEYLSVYIDSARARGAFPVLLTPIHRNKWSGSSIDDSHGDYPPAMRQLADEKNVPLIDMHRKSEVLFESLGETYVTDTLFMHFPAGLHSGYPEGSEDNTHFQEYGAYLLCELIVDGIKELQSDTTMALLTSSLLPAVHVRIMPEPALTGNVRGYGVYSAGKIIQLQAYPKTGYHFVNWTMNDEIIGDTNILEFELDSVNISITANFVVSPVSGVAPAGQPDDLRIFPNPAGDHIVIKSAERIEAVEFIDLKGRIFYSERCKDFYARVNLRGQMSPVFLVKVNTDKGYTIKMVTAGRR